MRLTDTVVRNLPVPAKGQKDYRDDMIRGFHVRISQGGSRVFYLMHGKARIRTRIGVYPIISLSQARQKAKELLAEKTLGKDRPKTITFTDALSQFLDNYTGRKPRTIKDTSSILNRHFLPPLKHERLGNITTEQIAHIIDRLRDKPTTARHALVVIKMFFSWCVGRHYVLSSPCEHIQAPQKPLPRHRVLDDGELAQVLAAAQNTPSPFGSILLLLALTGQRRGEIGALKWDYISAKTITLPAEVTKNNHLHTFPIGTWAQEIISTIPHRNTTNYLFPPWGTHDKPYSNWANRKEMFDKKCPLPHWTLHDLRRTFSTNMAKIGTPIHVTEKLLNHTSGTLSGVQAIYNQYTYLEEMKEAIRRHENHLQSIRS